LTVAVVALATLQGLLLPLLMLATGALVGALNSSESPVVALCVIGVLVAVQHLLDPVPEFRRCEAHGDAKECL